MILIVEDEQKLAALLIDYLAQESLQCECLYTGVGVTEHVQNNPPDLVLLDLMLPGKDGMQICREIRAFSSVPIMMMTAKVEEIDRILGLELGADDYICKPYSPREVIARVKAVLRRAQATGQGEPTITSRFSVDEDRFEVKFEGNKLDLTRVEFYLLKTLTSQPGRVFSRDHLMGSVYSDYRVVSDRTMDSHIKNLRKKIKVFNDEEELIRSVYGVGYSYESA